MASKALPDYRATLMTSNGFRGRPIGDYGADLARAGVTRVIVYQNDLFWGDDDGVQFVADARKLHASGVLLIPAIWCFDPTTNAEGFRPDGSPGELCRLSNDELIRRMQTFFGRIEESVRKQHEREVCWDSELYYATPGMNGGLMQVDRAWVATPDMDKRASTFGQLHKVFDFHVSTCVTTRHALLTQAWDLWWSRAMRAVALGKVYAEDTYGRKAIDPRNFNSAMFERIRFLLTNPSSNIAVLPGYWPSTMSWAHLGEPGMTKSPDRRFEADLNLLAKRFDAFSRASWVRIGAEDRKKVRQGLIRHVWYYDQNGEILDHLRELEYVHRRLGVIA